ncbi:peptidoglycan DD-metalloendopeptidase family protein [Streptomyces rimosus]|uniref:peptidoglycan DD-metalloendopeptidase family protein n=1 Tax=Streptomyces rimosus TaxID=1927 RepID=UPI0009974791|nr:M23 family metallopeptidase [Streptomyces rimosus]
MHSRIRTVPESVRTVIAWRPVPRAIAGRLAPAVRRVRGLRRVPRRPSPHPAIFEPARTIYRRWAGKCRRRAGGHTRVSPSVVRLLPWCAAGTALAVLLAGAAASGGLLTGAGTGSPDPEEATRFLQRRPAPAHNGSADSEPGRPPPATVGERAWPVVGPAGARPTVARGWEPPPAPWAPGHRGVDLLAAENATVRAAAPGRVLFAGKVAGKGVLSIEVSGSGTPPLRTTYEPVHPTVRKGDHVTAGQPVATIAPGPFHCSAPCLHWGLLRGKLYLDPLSLLPPSIRHSAPSRLLPVPVVREPRDESGQRDGSPPSYSRGTGSARKSARVVQRRSAATLQAKRRWKPGSRKPATGKQSIDAQRLTSSASGRENDGGRAMRGGPGREAVDGKAVNGQGRRPRLRRRGQGP